jgi:8-oxo-dGTP pyrophosphatase MutT (NUDIX family)
MIRRMTSAYGAGHGRHHDAMSSDELIARYDPDGAPVGAVSRARMRAEGLWHAATAVLVRSVDGSRVYLHRRSEDKDVFPGMYDCYAGGVVAAGETPDECAVRELAEELGVSGVTPTPTFAFRYEAGTIRYHAFTYEVRWDGPVVHQPSEVVSGEWIDLDVLRARLADPDWPFVPDGRVAIEEFFRRQDNADGQPATQDR